MVTNKQTENMVTTKHTENMVTTKQTDTTLCSFWDFFSDFPISVTIVGVLLDKLWRLVYRGGPDTNVQKLYPTLPRLLNYDENVAWVIK